MINDVRREFRAKKKPYPLTVDLVEHPTFWELRVYSEEVYALNQSQWDSIALWLEDTRKRITDLGLRCIVAGAEGAPC